MNSNEWLAILMRKMHSVKLYIPKDIKNTPVYTHNDIISGLVIVNSMFILYYESVLMVIHS